MLPGSVPGSYDKDEAWGDAALGAGHQRCVIYRHQCHAATGKGAYLEESLERPQRDELLEIMGETDTEDDDTPTEHV